MTPGEVARWVALGFAVAFLLLALIYGVVWLPGPDADPHCHGPVQSVHNGPGQDYKTIVCRDGTYHRLHG